MVEGGQAPAPELLDGLVVGKGLEGAEDKMVGAIVGDEKVPVGVAGVGDAVEDAEGGVRHDVVVGVLTEKGFEEVWECHVGVVDVDREEAGETLGGEVPRVVVLLFMLQDLDEILVNVEGKELDAVSLSHLLVLTGIVEDPEDGA